MLTRSRGGAVLPLQPLLAKLRHIKQYTLSSCANSPLVFRYADALHTVQGKGKSQLRCVIA